MGPPHGFQWDPPWDPMGPPLCDPMGTHPGILGPLLGAQDNILIILSIYKIPPIDF